MMMSDQKRLAVKDLLMLKFVMLQVALLSFSSVCYAEGGSTKNKPKKATSNKTVSKNCVNYVNYQGSMQTYILDYKKKTLENLKKPSFEKKLKSLNDFKTKLNGLKKEKNNSVNLDKVKALNPFFIDVIEDNKKAKKEPKKRSKRKVKPKTKSLTLSPEIRRQLLPDKDYESGDEKYKQLCEQWLEYTNSEEPLCQEQTDEYTETIFALKEQDCRAFVAEPLPAGDNPDVTTTLPENSDLTPQAEDSSSLAKEPKLVSFDHFLILIITLALIVLAFAYFGKKIMNRLQLLSKLQKDLIESQELVDTLTDSLTNVYRAIKATKDQHEKQIRTLENLVFDLFGELKKLEQRNQQSATNTQSAQPSVPGQAAPINPNPNIFGEDLRQSEFNRMGQGYSNYPSQNSSKITTPQRGGVNLGRQKKESPMAKAYDDVYRIWKENEKAFSIGIKRFDRLNKKLFSPGKYRDQLNIEHFNEELAEKLILPVLDLMAQVFSELIHLNIKSSGQYKDQIKIVHQTIYKVFAKALADNNVGVLVEIVPTKHTVDTTIQSVIESTPVPEKFKGKVYELHQVALRNMSATKLLRRAKVVGGV
jgi:hypothetical protein